MILSLVLLTFSFALVHGYWLGEPFQSWLSIFVTIYFLVCTWAFPYIFKGLIERSEYDMKRTGFTLFRGMMIMPYFVAPFIYVYLKYFDTKNEENKRKTQGKQSDFSLRGFIIASFLFLLMLPLLHIEWIGPFFESVISIIVSVYLGICVWTFSTTLNELEPTIDFFLEKRFSRIMLPFLYILLYVLSPLVYIGLKFLDKK